jgi:hypothetical protein
LKRVTTKYDAYKYVKFKHMITKCEWNDFEGKWHVHVENVDTGEVSLLALTQTHQALSFIEKKLYKYGP